MDDRRQLIRYVEFWWKQKVVIRMNAQQFEFGKHSTKNTVQRLDDDNSSTENMIPVEPNNRTHLTLD